MAVAVGVTPLAEAICETDEVVPAAPAATARSCWSLRRRLGFAGRRTALGGNLPETLFHLLVLCFQSLGIFHVFIQPLFGLLQILVQSNIRGIVLVFFFELFVKTFLGKFRETVDVIRIRGVIRSQFQVLAVMIDRFQRFIKVIAVKRSQTEMRFRGFRANGQELLQIFCGFLIISGVLGGSGFNEQRMCFLFSDIISAGCQHYRRRRRNRDRQQNSKLFHL